MPQSICRSVCRLTVVFAALTILLSGIANAADYNLGRLRDAAQTLNMFQGKNEKVNALISDVVKRLPEEARTGDSSLRSVDSNTTQAEIDNPDNVFVRSKDGSVRYIPKERLKEGLREFTRFMSDQKDFDDIWERTKDAVPDKYQPYVGAIDKLIAASESLRGTDPGVDNLLDKLSVFLPTSRADALQNQGVDKVMDALDKTSDSNRDQARNEWNSHVRPVQQDEGDQQPGDELPVDEPPVGEEPPLDEPPVDEPPFDEPPVDEPPLDEPPVDEPPVDEAPPVEPYDEPFDEPEFDEWSEDSGWIFTPPGSVHHRRASELRDRHRRDRSWHRRSSSRRHNKIETRAWHSKRGSWRKHHKRASRLRDNHNKGSSWHRRSSSKRHTKAETRGWHRKGISWHSRKASRRASGGGKASKPKHRRKASRRTSGGGKASKPQHSRKASRAAQQRKLNKSKSRQRKLNKRKAKRKEIRKRKLNRKKERQRLNKKRQRSKARKKARRKKLKRKRQRQRRLRRDQR